MNFSGELVVAPGFRWRGDRLGGPFTFDSSLFVGREWITYIASCLFCWEFSLEI